jgi:hypothetical protein
MGAVAYPAVSWTLFSTNLRAIYAGFVGLSIFLLVSVCLGDCRLGAAGNRVPEAEDLKADSWQGDDCAALPLSGEEMQRVGSIPGALHDGGFVVAGCRAKLGTYCWPFGPVGEAVADF